MARDPFSLQLGFGLAILLLATPGCGGASSELTQPSRPPGSLQTGVLSNPSPTPSFAPAPPATTVTVAFSGLRPGAYPVHVHSRCLGTQAFHIAIVESLRISGGRGAIAVSRGYFGRGLCLIVYSGKSLSQVIATRPL